MKTKLLLMLVALFALSASAGAVQIEIFNSDFEYPDLGPGESEWMIADTGWTYVGYDWIGFSQDANLPSEPVFDQYGWIQSMSNSTLVGGIAKFVGATMKADTQYTLTAQVSNMPLDGGWSGYRVQLVAGGAQGPPGGGYLGPISGGTVIAVDDNTIPISPGAWETVTIQYNYNPSDSELVGEPLWIGLLSLNTMTVMDYVCYDDVELNYDPNVPTVDAGIDMVTWSGREVQLDATVKNNHPEETDLTYAWSADPDTGVSWPDGTDVVDPRVVITKATDNPSVVTLTLACNNVGSSVPDVEKTITIDVYDDPCLAAIGTGKRDDNPTDIDNDDGECKTNLRDFAEVAAAYFL